MLVTEQNVARRRKIVAICQKMHEIGLVRGTAGNVSARGHHGLLITPSGVSYLDMKPTDIVHLNWDGQVDNCELLGASLHPASTEWHLHMLILKNRPQMGAVVHSHPPFATTLAVLEKPIPAVHYMVGVVHGSEVPCTTYKTFGTEALSEEVDRVMGHRSACLLSHHGMVAVAKTLDAALELTIQVEYLAEVYWRALAVGEPSTLPADEMELVLKRFKDMHYGPQ